MDKLSDAMQAYWEDVRFIDCHGSKCRRTRRTHAHDGYGIHCTACHGDLEESDYQTLVIPQTDVDSSSVFIIDCRGDKCRRSGKTHYNDGYGIHCVACYGELYDTDSDSDS